MSGEPYRINPELTEEIISILNDANDMTIATVREDGYPQATTVSYVNDGLKIYFGCAAASQKAQNLARNSKVSLTVNLPYASWNEIGIQLKAPPCEQQGGLPANRPPKDYTVRIIPRHPGAAIPAELPLILWQK